MTAFFIKSYRVLIGFSRILPVLLLPLLNSCSSHSSADKKGGEILVFENIIDSYNSSQFIEDISFIPLETNENCIIGNAFKLVKTDDRYFIFDGSSMKFYVFNHSGNYLYSFGNPGRGPGEYSDLTTFTIDTKKEWIIMLDNHTKLIKTDLYGKLLLEKSLPGQSRHFLMNIQLFNETLYAYTGQEHANEKKFQAIRFDENLNPVEYFLPYEYSFPGILGYGNSLYTFNNELILVSRWSYKIYRLRDGKFEERYSLNLDGKELSLEGLTPIEFVENKTRSYLFSICVEGDDVIFLPIFFEERPRYGFLLKKSNKFLLIKDIKQDSLAFVMPVSFANNKFISSLSSYYFHKAFPNNILNPDSTGNPIIVEYKINFRDE